MVADTKAQIKEVSAQELKAKLDAKEAVTVLDVREPYEWQAAFIPTSSNMPRGILEFKIDQKIADPNTPIIVYCRTGDRGTLATKALQDLGYKSVTNLSGGIKGWMEAGYSVYNRHGEFVMQQQAFEKKDEGADMSTRAAGCP